MIIICFGSLPSSYSSACCSPSSSSYCSWPTQPHWLWSRLSTLRNQKKHQQQSPYSCQEHQPKCSHRCESRRFRIFTDMHHLRRVRRVARLHNCWGRPTPKTTRIRSIIPSTIEFKHACSMSPRLRSSIGLFINSRDCINSIIRRDPAGMDKFHLSAELLSAFLATLWGAASASSSHLWMHFCKGHPQ